MMDLIHLSELVDHRILQLAKHVGQRSQAHFGRLGRENEEAGG
jgi:hypothetical protein